MTNSATVGKQFFEMTPQISMADFANVTIGNSLPVPVEGRIEGWDSDEIAVCHRIPDDRDLLSDTSRPRYVVSREFRELLQQLVPDQVQFLPIRLQSIDGETDYPNFTILRVLPWYTQIEAENDPRPLLMFRLPIPVGNIYVTSELRNEITKARIRQVQFE